MDHSIPAIEHHHPSWLVVVLVLVLVLALVLVLVLVVVDGSGRDNDMIGSLITSPDPSSVDVGCCGGIGRSVCVYIVCVVFGSGESIAPPSDPLPRDFLWE